jgi:hypothetical protein
VPFFAMFASDNEHIALMVNDFCCFECLYHTISVLVFVDDFEKLISRIAAPNQRGQSS